MKRTFIVLLVLTFVSACSGGGTPTESASQPTLEPVPATESVSSAPEPTVQAAVLTQSAAAVDDFFSQQGISLPAPFCSGLTPQQMEGPYYTLNTPERNSLLEEGMPGTRLILVGYVLDQNCQPLSNAWIDFWQADSAGEYDNSGYRLRGHQYTDVQGRYYLETILPGLYSSRPIEHIHVKVKPEGGEEVTSQLYFPDQPVEGLTVTLEDRGDHFVGYFNFVVQK